MQPYRPPNPASRSLISATEFDPYRRLVSCNSLIKLEITQGRKPPVHLFKEFTLITLELSSTDEDAAFQVIKEIIALFKRYYPIEFKDMEGILKDTYADQTTEIPAGFFARATTPIESPRKSESNSIILLTSFVQLKINRRRGIAPTPNDFNELLEKISRISCEELARLSYEELARNTQVIQDIELFYSIDCPDAYATTQASATFKAIGDKIKAATAVLHTTAHSTTSGAGHSDLAGAREIEIVYPIFSQIDRMTQAIESGGSFPTTVDIMRLFGSLQESLTTGPTSGDYVQAATTLSLIHEMVTGNKNPEIELFILQNSPASAAFCFEAPPHVRQAQGETDLFFQITSACVAFESEDTPPTEESLKHLSRNFMKLWNYYKDTAHEEDCPIQNYKSGIVQLTTLYALTGYDCSLELTTLQETLHRINHHK